MSDSDSDSDGAPEVISMSAGKKQIDDLKKKEIRNEIQINTKKNEKKREREQAKQARRKAILPKSLLVSLAEKETDKNKNDQEDDQDSDSEESEESEEIAPPPPKKIAVSRIVEGGVEVQIQKRAYKNSVVNENAKDFLQQHFYGSRVKRANYNSDIVQNPSLFARNK